jgi:hypothetical protein
MLSDKTTYRLSKESKNYINKKVSLKEKSLKQKAFKLHMPHNINILPGNLKGLPDDCFFMRGT